MSELQYIGTSKISPHPDNPRKEFGDLTELAESIKINGVLQNLTVVPWFSEITRSPADDSSMDGEYRVIIGHRRLAAAKLAGLTEVPCVVSHMGPRDQISAMLLENMQRADLTVYEQANGFQMMLNLGDKVADIAQRTGFSESTVRRRMKLLELDAEKFKASESRGATLQDYMELEKLESTDLKNEVLESIGTDNFKWKLKQAVDKQTAAKKLAALIERVSEFAIQVDTENGYRSIRGYSSYDKSEDIKAPDDADCVQYFFFVTTYGYVKLLKAANDDDNGENDEATAERELAAKEREAMDARRKQAKEVVERAYRLRFEFVSSCRVTKKNLPDIIEFMIRSRLENPYEDYEEDIFANLLEIDCPEEMDEGLKFEDVAGKLSESPERMLLLMAYSMSGDASNEGYFNSWNLEYSENGTLDIVYRLLIALGYQMSDDEKAMQDGTHELLIKEV